MTRLLDRLPFRKTAPAQAAEIQAADTLDALRRAAPGLIADGLRWAADALQRLARRTPEAAQAAVRKAPDGVETALRATARARKAPVAPAVLLFTGAGVAFWWWTQWARGRAESEAAANEED